MPSLAADQTTEVTPIVPLQMPPSRVKVRDTINDPQKRAMLGTLSAASAFIMTYLAKTPLGHAEEPAEVVDKVAEAMAQKEVEMATGEEKSVFLELWDKLSSLPSGSAFVAWASTVLVLQIALSHTEKSKKWNPVLSGLAIAAITRLGLAAMEQWGGNEALWWTTGGASVTALGFAVHERKFLMGLKNIFVKEGMKAAFDYFWKDKLPGEATEATVLPPCPKCKSDDRDADFCYRCNADFRTPVAEPAGGPAEAVVPETPAIATPEPTSSTPASAPAPKQTRRKKELWEL